MTAKKCNKFFLILIFSFIISRVIFYLIGIRFDNSTLTWFYQFLDIQDLKTDLLRSIFYLHIQPPLFNLFLGLVLNLTPGKELFVFQFIYSLMGLAMVILLFKLLSEFNVPAIRALIISLFFMISPPVVLFENWLFYEYPVALLLLLSCYFL